MKKALIIGCGIFLLLFLLMFGSCGYLIYKSYKNYPDYAKKDVVYSKYKNLLNEIDANVAKSSTSLDLAANLQKISMPPNLEYMALDKYSSSSDFDNNNVIEIVNKLKNHSLSTTTINGAGYGSDGKNKFVIIKYPINKFNNIKSCTIYLKHTEEHQQPSANTNNTDK